MAAAKIGGLFQQLKKEVLTIGTTKTVDQHFDTAKTNYDSFVVAVTQLQTHVNVWAASARAMCVNSELIAADYKNAMQTTTNHPFSGLAGDGKATQKSVYQHWELCEKQLEQTAGAKFKQFVAHFNQLKDRMKSRDAARLDFDYRTSQVKSAQKSRDDLIAKGKAEGPKDAEKRVLAEKKLEDASALWTTTNAALVADLVHLHDNRLALLGNVYIEFLSVQKAFAAGFNNSMDLLSVPGVPVSCTFNLHANPNDAKSAAAGEGEAGLQDVNLNPAVSRPAAAGAAPAGNRPPPPPTSAPPARTKQQQQAALHAQQQQQAAALIASAMPEMNVTPTVSSEGLHLSASFADDDEAAMRVTVKPQDAAAAAAFAVKHQAAISKLATVSNKTNG